MQFKYQSHGTRDQANIEKKKQSTNEGLVGIRYFINGVIIISWKSVVADYITIDRSLKPTSVLKQRRRRRHYFCPTDIVPVYRNRSISESTIICILTLQHVNCRLDSNFKSDRSCAGRSRIRRLGTESILYA